MSAMAAVRTALESLREHERLSSEQVPLASFEDLTDLLTLERFQAWERDFAG